MVFKVLKINKVAGGVTFTARIVPGSSREGICGLHDGMVKVKISAPPEKGKANESLIGFLSKMLGVKKRAVSIISGKTNPIKKVQVLGIEAETLLDKLNLAEKGS